MSTFARSLALSLAAAFSFSFAAVFCVSPSHAATISFSSAAYSDLGISTSGTLVGALNLGDDLAPHFTTNETINGVLFTQQDQAGANSVALSGGVVVNIFNGSAANVGGLGGVDLLPAGMFTNNNSANGTVTFTGLTAGADYEVQLVINDQRTLAGLETRTVNIYDQSTPTGTPEIADLDFTTAGGGSPQLITGTFTADGTASQTLFIQLDTDGDYTNGFGGLANFPGQLNALQLRVSASAATPEPSALVLAVLGLVGLTATSRRRNRRS